MGMMGPMSLDLTLTSNVSQIANQFTDAATKKQLLLAW
jgi:hypothetical protein